MLKTLNALIFGCLLLFITPLMASDPIESEQSDQLVGTHIARVIVPRAIVYSDENMNSPLGYITNDKLITVGNPRKRNPDLVPLVVYGRLGYIESKNIHFENESIELLNAKRGAPREHNIDITLSKPEEKLSENNSAYLVYHQFSAGADTKNLENNVDNTPKSTFTGFNIFLVHRQTVGRFFWGAGYEYDILSSQNLKFELYMINAMAGYTPIRNALFLLDLTFSLDLSIATQLKITTLHEPPGFIFGPQFGARGVFFPNQRYHPFVGLGYRAYKVLRMTTLTEQNGNNIPGISKMNGINFSLGVGIEI